MKIKIFEENTKGTDFFVGDIHGCFDELKAKMKSKRFVKSKDRLFACGDLVDRGPDSVQFLKWVDKPWFHSVMGNHDFMAHRYPSGLMDTENYIRNGGQWMVDTEVAKQQVISDVMSRLPFMIEVQTSLGKVGVCHAEVIYDDWALCKENIHRKVVRDHLMWSRDKISVWNADGSKNQRLGVHVKGVDLVVCGHTPMISATKYANVCYIDTGAGKAGCVKLYTAEELFKLAPLC